MSTSPSLDQLKRALAITEQIARLEEELQAVLKGSGSAAPISKTPTAARPAKKKKTMSPEARAKIAAAARARWAAIKGPTDSSTPAIESPAAPAPKKRGLTAAGRARLSAQMKARWAAKKKGAPAASAPAKSAPKARKKSKK